MPKVHWVSRLQELAEDFYTEDIEKRSVVEQGCNSKAGSKMYTAACEFF